MAQKYMLSPRTVRSIRCRQCRISETWGNGTREMACCVLSQTKQVPYQGERLQSEQKTNNIAASSWARLATKTSRGAASQ